MDLSHTDTGNRFSFTAWFASWWLFDLVQFVTTGSVTMFNSSREPMTLLDIEPVDPEHDGVAIGDHSPFSEYIQASTSSKLTFLGTVRVLMPTDQIKCQLVVCKLPNNVLEVESIIGNTNTVQLVQ